MLLCKQRSIQQVKSLEGKTIKHIAIHDEDNQRLLVTFTDDSTASIKSDGYGGVGAIYVTTEEQKK